MPMELNQEITYTNKKYENIFFVFWAKKNPKFIWSESQYHEFAKSIRLLKNESLSLKIVEKDANDQNWLFCEVSTSSDPTKRLLWAHQHVVEVLTEH